MARYAVVDTEKLDADLTSVADAIREKAGTEDPLAFPDGFVRAVEPLVKSEDYLAAVLNKEVTEIVNPQVVVIPPSFQRDNTRLKKVDLRNLTSVPDYAFYGCTDLSDVNFSGAISVGSNSFGSCPSLQSFYFPSLDKTEGWGYCFNQCQWTERFYFPVFTGTIVTHTFTGCFRLKTLVLGASSVCTLDATDAFNETPIAGYTGHTNGEKGYIYVPSALVDSYKAATNWSTFASQFRAIEDYPEVLEGWE